MVQQKTDKIELFSGRKSNLFKIYRAKRNTSTESKVKRNVNVAVVGHCYLAAFGES